MLAILINNFPLRTGWPVQVFKKADATPLYFSKIAHFLKKSPQHPLGVDITLTFDKFAEV